MWENLIKGITLTTNGYMFLLYINLLSLVTVWVEAAWAKVGFRNISKNSTRCRKHETSSSHIANMVYFIILGQNSMRMILSQS